MLVKKEVNVDKFNLSTSRWGHQGKGTVSVGGSGGARGDCYKILYVVLLEMNLSLLCIANMKFQHEQLHN